MIILKSVPDLTISFPSAALSPPDIPRKCCKRKNEGRNETQNRVGQCGKFQPIVERLGSEASTDATIIAIILNCEIHCRCSSIMQEFPIPHNSRRYFETVAGFHRQEQVSASMPLSSMSPELKK